MFCKSGPELGHWTCEYNTRPRAAVEHLYNSPGVTQSCGRRVDQLQSEMTAFATAYVISY